MHAIMFHPNSDALLAELQSHSPYAPFREESKQMIHTQRNAEGFELCQISYTIQCLSHCLNHLKEGIVYCDCGTCLIPSEEERRLNKDQ